MLGLALHGHLRIGRAVEVEMRKLTDIAVTLARYDKRMLAMTTGINLMDKRWYELSRGRGTSAGWVRGLQRRLLPWSRGTAAQANFGGCCPCATDGPFPKAYPGSRIHSAGDIS
jgi:hypothetical protein